MVMHHQQRLTSMRAISRSKHKLQPLSTLRTNALRLAPFSLMAGTHECVCGRCMIIMCCISRFQISQWNCHYCNLPYRTVWQTVIAAAVVASAARPVTILQMPCLPYRRRVSRRRQSVATAGVPEHSARAQHAAMHELCTAHACTCMRMHATHTRNVHMPLTHHMHACHRP